MKKWVLAGLILMIGAMTSYAVPGLALYGSYWDTKDIDDAYGGGAKLKLELTPVICLEFRGTYFDAFKHEESGPGYKEEDKLRIIPVEAGVVLDMPIDPVWIYAGGGAGYYIFDDGEINITMGDETTSLDVDFDNEWGWYAVAGIEFSLSRQVALFCEAQYRWVKAEKGDIKSEGADLDFDDADIKLDGFGVNAGMLFPW